MKFYTYSTQWGNKILFRGYENGRAILLKDDFKPTLYIKSKSDKSDYKSLYGDYVEPITFGDIRDAKEFVKKYEDVENFDVFGMTQFQYQYINNNYKGDIQYDVNQMKISILDIEVVGGKDDGFPDIGKANLPIRLITLFDRATKKAVIFGDKPYEGNNKKFEYRYCKDEVTLLKNFVLEWQSQYPDIVTGWNSDMFDFPYLINRISLILGDEWVKKLSPFNMVNERIIEVRGREVQTYEIMGVTQLDYLNLYKKWGTYSAKESYALGFIAQEEIGRTKLEPPTDSFYSWYTGTIEQTSIPDNNDIHYKIKMKAYQKHLIEEELKKRKLY